MPLSFARHGAAAVAAAIALAVPVTVSSPAAAAEPDDGRYRYYTEDPAAPGVVKDGIFFEVREIRGEKVISGADWISDVCGRMSIPDTLPVNSKGKAKYKGAATRSGGTPVQVKLNIKFTKSTKAKITVRDRDPSVDCVALRKVTARPY